MLSHTLKRYFEPLRLPIRPAATSIYPYTQRLALLRHHRTGSPALHCSSATTCRPCYPGRFRKPLPFSTFTDNGLPHTSTGSASPTLLTRLHIGSLTLRPVALPIGNSRPPVTRTPLPWATRAYGQLPGRDF